MESVNNKYYNGFEGEPEIQFICRKGNDNAKLYGESVEILMLLCNILREAILNKYEVSIDRE